MSVRVIGLPDEACETIAKSRGILTGPKGGRYYAGSERQGPHGTEREYVGHREHVPRKIVRVHKVEDTRVYEEGPDDRFHPVPGSGDVNQCNRCGRDHEVHATVELDDGSVCVVGTGCMHADEAEAKSRIKSAEASAKTLRRLEFERAKAQKDLETFRAAKAQVDALPMPPVVESTEPYKCLYGTNSGKEMAGVVMTCGDSQSRAHYDRPDREALKQTAAYGWRVKRLGERLPQGASTDERRYEVVVEDLDRQIGKIKRRIDDIVNDKAGQDVQKMLENSIAHHPGLPTIHVVRVYGDPSRHWELEYMGVAGLRFPPRRISVTDDEVEAIRAKADPAQPFAQYGQWPLTAENAPDLYRKGLKAVATARMAGFPGKLKKDQDNRDAAAERLVEEWMRGPEAFRTYAEGIVKAANEAGAQRRATMFKSIVLSWDDLLKSRGILTGPKGGRYYAGTERRDARGRTTRQYVGNRPQAGEAYSRWGEDVRKRGERDKRLAEQGQTLRRVYQGQQIEVTEDKDGIYHVVVDGKEAGQGRSLTGSLSAALGRPISGFAFMRLGSAWDKTEPRDWKRVDVAQEALRKKLQERMPGVAIKVEHRKGAGVRAHFEKDGEKYVMDLAEDGAVEGAYKQVGTHKWERVEKKQPAAAPVPEPKKPEPEPEPAPTPAAAAGKVAAKDAEVGREYETAMGHRVKVVGKKGDRVIIEAVKGGKQYVVGPDTSLSAVEGQQPAPAPAPEPEPEPAPTPKPVEPPPAPAPSPAPAPVEKPKPAPKPKPAEKPVDVAEGTARQRLTAEGYGDVGQKLQGARKDIAALKQLFKVDDSRAVTAAELDTIDAEDPTFARSVVTRDRMLGKKQEVGRHLKEMGVNAGAAYLRASLIALADEKPPDSPEARKMYVAGVHRLQEAMSTWLTRDDALKGLEAIREEAAGRFYLTADERPQYIEAMKTLNGVNARIQRLQDNIAATDENVRRGTVPTDYYKKMAQMYRDELAGMKDSGRKAQQVIAALDAESTKRATAAGEVPPDKLLRALGTKFLTHGLGVVPADVQLTFDQHQEAHKQFSKLRSNTHWHGMYNEWKWAEPRKTGERKKPDPENPDESSRGMHHGEKYERIVPETVERKGGRTAKFKADTVASIFGFRGVQYGNWMDADSTYMHTQHAGEAMIDFADVLGIDPKHISLHGRIGLAFGARGSGKASAHYEPGNMVINLTRTRGGGTLAHEWGHALDNIMGHVSHGAKSHHTSMATTDMAWTKTAGAEMPEAVKEAWQKVGKAIVEGEHVPHETLEVLPASKDASGWRGTRFLDTLLARNGNDPENAIADYIKQYHHLKKSAIQSAAQYYADKFQRPVNAKVPMKVGKGSRFVAAAGRLDKGKPDGYWSRPHELFARAWEAFVQDELEAKGQRNTYLVWGTAVGNGGMGDAKTRDGDELHIYPRGEERARINAAMRELVAALRDTGMMYKAMALLAGRPRLVGLGERWG